MRPGKEGSCTPRGTEKRGIVHQESLHGSLYTFSLRSLQRRLRGHLEVLDLARDLVAARHHVEVVLRRVWGAGLRVWGSGCRVQGSGSRGRAGLSTLPFHKPARCEGDFWPKFSENECWSNVDKIQGRLAFGCIDGAGAEGEVLRPKFILP